MTFLTAQSPDCVYFYRRYNGKVCWSLLSSSHGVAQPCTLSCHHAGALLVIRLNNPLKRLPRLCTADGRRLISTSGCPLCVDTLFRVLIAGESIFPILSCRIVLLRIIIPFNNYILQCVSSRTDSCSTCLYAVSLWDGKVHCRVQKSPPIPPVDAVSLGYSLKPRFFTTRYMIVLPSAFRLSFTCISHTLLIIITTRCAHLTLLFSIREVTGSNLGPETGYPDWAFSCFFSVPPRKFWDSTLS
jgi:hypothetical protein